MNRRSFLTLLPAALIAALLPRTRPVEAADASLSGEWVAYRHPPIMDGPRYKIGWTTMRASDLPRSISSNTATTLSSARGWDRDAYTCGPVSFAASDDWHPPLTWDGAS